MNERFLELAKQCGDWTGQTIEMNDAGVEKFVELIKQAIYDVVKEELILDTYIDTPENGAEDRAYLRGCNGGTVDALCRIKNFGINIDL